MEFNPEDDPANEKDWNALKSFVDPLFIPEESDIGVRNSTYHIECSCDRGMHSVLHDTVQGDYVCTGCGLTHRAHPRGGFIQYYRVSVYNSLYHFHERLNMARDRDTRIHDNAFRIIRSNMYRRYGRRRKRHYKRDQIRRVLADLNQTSPSPNCVNYWTKRWLERWPQITVRITGLPGLYLDDIGMDRLDDIFVRTQRAWARVRSEFPTRSHMPNFSYMIIQILRFMGLPLSETLPWFHQLKPDKLRINERYWRAICLHNRWPFISIFPNLQSIK